MIGTRRMIDNTMKEIKNNIDVIGSVSGTFFGFKVLGTDAINKLTPSLHEKYVRRQKLNALLSHLTTVVGKSLENRLTDADIIRYNKIVSEIDNSPKEALEKLSQLLVGVQNKYNDHYNFLTSLKYDVGTIPSNIATNPYDVSNKTTKTPIKAPEKAPDKTPDKTADKAPENKATDYKNMKKEDVLALIRARRKDKK